MLSSSRLTVSVLGLGLLLGWPRIEPAEADSPARDGSRSCRPEKILPFLVRKNFIHPTPADGQAHARAVRWRAEKYGFVPGLGLEGYNSESATGHIRSTRFMGLPVSLHEKVIPSLRCVERQIQQKCRAPVNAYQPRAIGGVRTINTYHRGEVSNHLFGIAIDIDPDKNPCCHCVEPWPSHPACHKAAGSVYERAELTRCWIQAFERHGFYWLGHDQLEDTMHFEYLADPDAARGHLVRTSHPTKRSAALGGQDRGVDRSEPRKPPARQH